MKTKVTKAIIPAAGFGTRFLPITKSIPKEMLPIVDVPVIQYIVKEVVESGIKDILIVVSSNKNALIDYFDSNFALETNLLNKKKIKELKSINDVTELANIQYVRQKYPLGLGDAILCAKSFINDEPFAVILGDDIIRNRNKNNIPGLEQCINIYNRTKKMVLGVQHVLHEDTKKYGIVNPTTKLENNHLSSFEIKGIVEKPTPDHAPSDYAAIGRYILPPTIFNEIEKLEPSDRGEIELTPALQNIIKKHGAYACNIVGERYDTGAKFGLIKAILDESLFHDEVKDQVKEYIQFLNSKLNSNK
ncbi:UTP--glucose-1-phosphate uridylyltransferase [bacterium]|nr:UTP--glucose-1-phosphate uridylyltransferase [bacterium]